LEKLGEKLGMPRNITKEKLIHKGAEASLFYGHWFGKEVIFKHRILKDYRIEQLDRKIDTESSTIIMKYISGSKLKNLIKTLDAYKKEEIFAKLGRIIAILHINGHIHGDITTSNIILTSSDNLFLIDFGLHDYSDSIEDKSVDLHLLKKVLISSHGDDFKLCFNAFLEGYKSEYKDRGINAYNEIIRNISVIETRGRYVKKENRL
jgi:Kae1-associated kinase Bud32